MICCVYLRLFFCHFNDFLQKTTKIAKVPRRDGQKIILVQGRIMEGAFFVHVTGIVGHALQQKFGCYQKILGSPLFVAEITGLHAELGNLTFPPHTQCFHIQWYVIFNSCDSSFVYHKLQHRFRLNGVTHSFQELAS